MISGDIMKARNEIYRTLGLCNICTRMVGLSFIDEVPNNLFRKIGMHLWLIISMTILLLMLAGEIDYVATKFVTSSSVVEFVSSLHIVGYGTMSFGKLLTIWYKRNVFKHLLRELEDIWPVAVDDKAAVEIKRGRLSGLRIGQFCMRYENKTFLCRYIHSLLVVAWLGFLIADKNFRNIRVLRYAFWNILGVWMYNLTPIVVYFYKKIQGVPANIGYVWLLCYPFDKTKPGYHEFAFIFEAYGGVVSVWSMLGSDMLFMTMSSHISMLLQILQVKIRRLGYVRTETTNKDRKEMHYCYSEIVSVIKIHQRLITYGNNLEDAFSVVNLINVLLSSVNICCVVFNILLDPWMALSNKFFLGAALTQVGILCWYADDIYTSSVGVGDAVYESGWYNTDIRSRRLLFLLIQRSQKPLYFTAFKFRSITMTTYSSILTSSYSYFTLLYTVYRSD